VGEAWSKAFTTIDSVSVLTVGSALRVGALEEADGAAVPYHQLIDRQLVQVDGPEVEYPG